MTETNANIHVLADETLGGIKREYVEVDRKAEVGEKIVIVESESFPKGFIGTVDEFDDYYDEGSFDLIELCEGEGFVDAEADVYHVLEPTDIVHIYSLDGMRRCVLTDRKAEVGEEVIFNNESGVSDGIVTEVTSVGISMVDVAGYEDSDGEYVCGISHGYYRVLVPVEAAEDEPKPADPIDVIANLAQEVAELKRTVARHRDEIDTLYKDKRTLGEELARLAVEVGKETELSAKAMAEAFVALRRAGL